ncbi:MAG: hypothetical protein ABL997_05115 [Planctomycetota bacterium]
MLEDPADAVRVVDGGEQSAATAAIRAGQHIDEVGAAQQLGPGVALARAAVPLWSVGDGRLALVVHRVAVEGLVLQSVDAVGRARRLRVMALAIVVAVGGTIRAIVIVWQQRRRDDAVPDSRGRSQHAMLGEHDAPRSRLQRAEVFEEGERIEDDVGGAVAIPLLQPIADATIGQQRPALFDDRRARGVAVGLLESLTAASGNAGIGVE